MRKLGRFLKGVLIAVAVVGAFFLIMRGCQAYQADEASAVRSYFRAIGSGDTKAACDIVSESALDKLKSRLKAENCEAAVRRLFTGLSSQQRDHLVHEDLDVYSISFSGGRKEVQLSYSPLGTIDFVVYERDGRERITDTGLDAMRL